MRLSINLYPKFGLSFGMTAREVYGLARSEETQSRLVRLFHFGNVKTSIRHAYTGKEVAAEYAGLAAVLIAEIQDRSRFWHFWRDWVR